MEVNRSSLFGISSDVLSSSQPEQIKIQKHGIIYETRKGIQEQLEKAAIRISLGSSGP